MSVFTEEVNRMIGLSVGIWLGRVTFDDASLITIIVCMALALPIMVALRLLLRKVTIGLTKMEDERL